ncbi:hypothetical protein [Sphingomicrobium lutaoense]|uniref:Uncharacterized protein n=1 Tax=Sphingomicrobium lutaoense TaxID=515949 RepID=A0A839Z708_9SPHN|nr:hypothetical protein [Sphingomicrobium lutaoense]MBB3764554.1 hypothetical protein [Sphingomicrobium lutaoense]
MTDLDDEFDPVDEMTGRGGMLAIGLLVLAILMLVFLFRDELGIGTPQVDISIPDDLGVAAPPAPDETTADNVMADNAMAAPAD